MQKDVSKMIFCAINLTFSLLHTCIYYIYVLHEYMDQGTECRSYAPITLSLLLPGLLLEALLLWPFIDMHIGMYCLSLCVNDLSLQADVTGNRFTIVV